jgi:hypothetical protein
MKTTRIVNGEKIVIITDNSDYTTRGQKISYRIRKEKEVEKEVLEPFDPEYIGESSHKISNYVGKAESKYIRMVAKLQRTLRKMKVAAEWDGTFFNMSAETFRGLEVRRVWVDREDDTYCYGDLDSCIDYSEDVEEITERAQRFVSGATIR